MAPEVVLYGVYGRRVYYRLKKKKKKVDFMAIICILENDAIQIKKQLLLLF